MKGLTERQKEILDFIREFIQRHSFSPSYEEVKQHFGFSSLGTVQNFVRILKRKGYLSAEKYCGRSLALAEAPAPAPVTVAECELPFIGYLSGCSPPETFLRSQSLAVPASLVPHPENCYVLKVRGQDLTYQHMLDGDLLIVEASSEADEGALILGTIKGKETLVRYYHPEGAYVRLDTGDPEAAPRVLPYDDLEIQGIIVGLIRLYSL